MKPKYKSRQCGEDFQVTCDTLEHYEEWFFTTKVVKSRMKKFKALINLHFVILNTLSRFDTAGINFQVLIFLLSSALRKNRFSS
jgi:hypothetical protein